MIARNLQIMGVSDVSLGYGSPQVPALVSSLVDHYGTSRATVLEPDQSQRPQRAELFDKLDLVRLSTRRCHYSPTGQIEYNRQVARLLDEKRPDVVVLSSSLVLPGFLRARHRPRLTLYYMLESLSYYSQGNAKFGRAVILLNRQAAPWIDVVIFPEENRAVHDLVLGGFQGRHAVIMYNTIAESGDLSRVVPAQDRSPRILYSGTIHRELTLGKYFLRPEIHDVPIDLWGLVDGERAEQFQRRLTISDGGIRYRGYVDTAALAQWRRRYAYSIVMWSPIDTHTLYAAPNKFFEAIADGVPPIAAPHPQCKMLIERYQCGILMRDWSFAAFQAALSQAQEMFGTPDYEQMVSNCRLAVEQELNYRKQFAKVRRLLPDLTENESPHAIPTHNASSGT
ncbi:MAG: glycosyltransferase [Planctomycetia bacterium]|nr:glycosyltransferase [Planctomycetia bacterium]